MERHLLLEHQEYKGASNLLLLILPTQIDLHSPLAQ